MSGLECLGNCKTIGELKKKLETLSEDLLWYGWDDGCIIITIPEPHCEEIGYIDNKGVENDT